MRINKYIASATGISRRKADDAITKNRVLINSKPPLMGQKVLDEDLVTLDGQVITPDVNTITIMLHKPIGYVCSRDGQGNKTIYELIPPELHHLKPVGRLDMESSGLLLLTNDGDYAHRLTHPRYKKTKMYTIALDKPLNASDHQKIEQGIKLEDGVSSLRLKALTGGEYTWQVTMNEGRNRQIRRTFAALGYTVIKLHRTQFGEYSLGELASGVTIIV